MPSLLNFGTAQQVLKTPVSKDMLGRVFNGSGKPIDGGCVSAGRHDLLLQAAQQQAHPAAGQHSTQLIL
jgi:vacuolar-type H+-ATPase subunit B/Vma2